MRHVRSLRLLIIDADQIGHELLADASVRQQLRELFGAGVFGPDGLVDRRSLAALVFGESAAHQQSRRRLEQVLHPAIRRETLRRIQLAPQDVDAVILDAALLLEAGWADECTALIFIDTPLSERQRRVQAGRGWSADELLRREAAQLPVDVKKARADFVVDNSGTPEAAARQMENCLQIILSRFVGGSASSDPVSAP